MRHKHLRVVFDFAISLPSKNLSVLYPQILRLLFPALLLASSFAEAAENPNCRRTLRAEIVAIDQPLMFNRLGAQNINGMIFALKRDIVDDSEPARPLTMGGLIQPGHVFLRPDKRPRPLVLRVAEQDCLEIKLTNLLTNRSNPREPILTPPTTLGSPPTSLTTAPPKEIGGAFPSPRFDSEVDDQVTDRMVGFHVQGMQLVQTIVDDATMVGRNPSGMVAPGGTITYHLYAEHEGAFLATSHGATFGGDATAGNSSNGLFASVNVEPLNARFYRSQLTEEELRLASSTDEQDVHHIGGQRKEGPRQSKIGQPVVDYEAVYPNTSPWAEEGKAGLPILNMLSNDEIVHSDINAIIAGPDADGSWTSKCPKKGETPPALDSDRKVYDEKYKECPYPLEKVGRTNPTLPDRLEAFREFTVIFHDQMSKTNAFPHFYSHRVKDENGAEIVNPLAQTLKAVGDVFMINYGSGGVGSEMIANRLGVGPMHDCLSCAAEEFFLTSHAVGDPAMIVDVPANFGLDQCRPIAVKGDASKPLSDITRLADCGPPHPPEKINTIVGDNAKSLRLIGPKATRALYPDDPSNVHHSYINDHVKFRNLHTGKEHHIFHLHNHQWLYSPNDDNANYLDAQAIGPGSSYTYEINFGGSGNRNKSAGDAIFHCHLYPHFAQGMWELWRVHDVMETGTPLEVSGAVDGYHVKPFALQSGLPAQDPADTSRRLRALPDGEITAGTPIPAVIPLPGKAIAPMPGKVYVVSKSGSTTPTTPQRAAGDKQISGLGSVASIDRHDLVDASALSDEEKAANAAKTPLGAVLNPPLGGDKFLKNPGYPFWIAGMEYSVGQRPPTPPLDMLPAAPGKEANAGGWDGGLPRHSLDGVLAAKSVLSDNSAPSIDNLSRYDLSKKLVVAKPFWFPEDGTDIEKVAMAFHAVRKHPSYAVDTKGKIIDDPDRKINFITNGGGKPLAGSPFHNPCIDDKGHVLNKDIIGNFFDGHGGIETKGLSPFSSDYPRVYKGADIQFDAVFNKAGWHFPQERIIALWDDVRAIISKTKAPEPLVMRNNTFDCTEFLHTNLVPEIYELDDYQVRTSTDIIGQHIHLPKWDLTTTDGAGNGWNYEDGTLSPGAVRERIEAINKYNSAATDPVIKNIENRPVYTSENLRKENKSAIGKELEPAKHPYFDEAYPFKLDEGPNLRTQNWLGARTTYQRWFFDPVINSEGGHRGLGIIFTHDHYGPSTHQQVGLYATVLVEPAGSEWIHNETGEKMGVRADGGPTSWQAIVRTGANQSYLVTDKDPTLKVKPAGSDLDGDGEDDSYREFYLEYSDFQHAYLPGKYVGADPNGAIASIAKKGEVDFLVEKIKDPKLAPYLPDETSYKFAINPPIKDDVARTNPLNLVEYAAACKIFGSNFRRPCAEAITADDPGTFVVNYRNEPVGLRIQDTSTGGQASDRAGDLAYALKTFRLEDKVSRAYKVSLATFGREDSSGKRGVLDAQPREGDRIGGVQDVIGREPTCFPRPLQVKFGAPAIPENQQGMHQQGLCQQPWNASSSFASPLAEDGDPFTPIMRAYDADHVRVKIQAGGHEETHNASIHGVKWLQGGSGYGFDPNSGWRNSQQAGISEQFTFASPLVPFSNVDKNKAIVRLEKLKTDNRSKEGLLASISRFLAEFFRSMLNVLAWFFGFPIEDTGKNIITTEDIILRKLRDYLYTIDASTEGYWNGSWGLLRSYSEKGRKDLQVLPNAKKTATIFRPVGVCPVNSMGIAENIRKFDISAVLANDVLDNKVDAKLAPGAPVLNGKLNQQENGVLSGTLVYNPRKVAIRDADIPADPGDGLLSRSYKGHPDGVLQDPTAIMYVYTSDLTTKKGAPDACLKNGKVEPDAKLCPGAYLRLKEDNEYKAPVEPLVMRAAAGDCIELTLRNLIGEKGAPDILTYRKLAPVIPRFPDQPDGTVLNSNRVRTSSIIGLHAALVAYDIAADDGTAVGVNDDSITLALPNSEKGVVSYLWYAGDISMKPFDKTTATYLPVYTPVEFGAANLMPADKIKQGQKALVGALVIEPEGSKWMGMSCKTGVGENCLDTVADHQGGGGERATRLSTTVLKRDGSRFRDLVTVFQDGLAQVYGDGKPVEGITAEDIVAEDAQDSGAMAINYGSEPLWFRYGLLPLLPFTGPKTPAGAVPISFRDVPNAHQAYSNSLAYKTKEDILREQSGEETKKDQSDSTVPSVRFSGEPAVPVLTAIAGDELRMHVLHPVGNARGSVFNLHGHVWPRAPYNCPGDAYLGMKNVCPETGFFPTINHFKVGSRAIGENQLSMIMGGQDSVMPAAHFDILLKEAGGKFKVPGDYLYRDQASLGNLAGLWGVVRVQPSSDAP